MIRITCKDENGVEYTIETRNIFEALIFIRGKIVIRQEYI
jgi:hypothetical protein